MNNSRLNLYETGTRFEHYLELQELFLEAVQMLKDLNPAYRTDVDEAKITRLQNAADAVWGRISHLSDYVNETTYGSAMQKEIDLVGRNRKLLTEGSNASEQADGSGT